MKDKKQRKIRFKAPPLGKIEEDPLEQEQERQRRLSSRDYNLSQQRRRSSAVARVNKSRRTSQAVTDGKARQLLQSVPEKKPENVVKTKASKHMEAGLEDRVKSKRSMTPEKNKAASFKDGTQGSRSPLDKAVRKTPENATGNESPSKSPGAKSGQKGKFSPNKSGLLKDVANQEKLKQWERLRDRTVVSKLPEIQRKGSGLVRAATSADDALSLPFGGARRLSDTNLFAAQPATNIIYMINQARKKRLKESINAQIAAVHDRVRKALEHADIYEDDQENKDEESKDSTFDTHSKRETMKNRNELIYRLREHIEDCHERMVLITDVNNWIQIQQKELQKELVSEEEMDDATVQYHIGHKKILYALDALTDCTSKISVIGQKLIEIAGNIINASSKGKVEKIHVIDEKTMLSNKVKWDQAVSSIISLFDDAARWVKGAPFKAALRNGKKQYQVLILAVDKRLAELAEMSKFAEDLQNKLMMSKEMINKFSKDADDNKRMVDRLGKELQALQSQMSITLETNKNLTSQLSTLEGQVKGMKAELSKPPPPPPRPPSPPPVQPPPPQASESSKQLMEKTRQHLGALEQEIQEYRMLVNNLTARIDELEDQLAKEQKRVRFLKDSIDTQPVMEARPPEPVVEVPTERAPPPEISSDSSSSYYKTLLSGMKKDFMQEVDKIKDHLKREQNRNDAGVRRMEQSQKEQIQTIMKDCLRILRAIVHYRDQVAIMLDKEGFNDSARQLHQLPKLVHDNVGQDPKDILMYMAGNTVDYLHSMEVVLNHTMLAIKVNQKSGTVGSYPPISQDQVFKQMEERMEEIRQPSKIRSVMKSPVKWIKSRSRRKDRQNIKKLQGMVSQFENKYVCLLDHYKLVWKLYNEQRRDMDTLESEFDQTIKRKVKEKENLVVTAIKTELKERRAIHEHQLQMSIADQKKNLQLLDKAFEENRISRELHQMATSLLNQAMEIPRKRFRYMIERYIAHRAVKEAETKVTNVLQEEKLSMGQRSEIMVYMDQMQQKLLKELGIHHQSMQRLETERRDIFNDIWNVFNEVLVDTGVLLIQPVFMEVKRETYTHIRLQKRKKVKGYLGQRRRQLLDLPTGLVGSTIPLTFKVDKPMWRPQGPIELSPAPAVNTPVFLEMDVNRQRLLAKRQLKVGPRLMYPVAETRSFTICNEIHVDYITTALMCK